MHGQVLLAGLDVYGDPLKTQPTGQYCGNSLSVEVGESAGLGPGGPMIMFSVQ